MNPFLASLLSTNTFNAVQAVLGLIGVSIAYVLLLRTKGELRKNIWYPFLALVFYFAAKLWRMLGTMFGFDPLLINLVIAAINFIFLILLIIGFYRMLCLIQKIAPPKRK